MEQTMEIINRSDDRSNSGNITTPPTIAFVGVSRQLVTYVIPILFGFGTVGNIMTIAVLLRRGVRQSTATFYLFVLSVCDLLCLYVGMPVFYVNELSETNFRDTSEIVCRLHTFLTYCFTHMVAWTIVAMQIDRTIWVALPFRAKQICTIRNASITILLIAIALILFNNHFLWTLEVRLLQDLKVKCTEMDSYAFFAGTVVGLMDVGIFSLVPSVIMFVCNTIITVKLKRFVRNRSRLLSRQTSTYSHANVSNVPSNAESHRSGSISLGSTSKDRSLTIMLQTVSTFFIVTTLPVCATNLAYTFAFSATSDPFSVTAMIFYGLQTIANLLAYLNISVQFILYFLSCKNFRNDVRAMTKAWLGRCGFKRRRELDRGGSNSPTNGTFQTVASSDDTKSTAFELSRAKSVQLSSVSKSILKRHSETIEKQQVSLARATVNVHA